MHGFQHVFRHKVYNVWRFINDQFEFIGHIGVVTKIQINLGSTFFIKFTVFEILRENC